MRHLQKLRKFGVKKNQRVALLKNLAGDLIVKGRLQTSTAKAKSVAIKVEHLITLAKKQNLASFRLLKQRLPAKAADKLYYEIAPKMAKRQGGYTRIIKLAERKTKDQSEQAIISLLD
ncbi:MAG: 50S ribosomal protein L17 [Minisyncoccia bacterium]|jgi:large subunit ribosomal protein L17